MKRSIEENGEIESTSMPKCLKLLPHRMEDNTSRKHMKGNNIFQCKTCKRQFQSFQALGGHRASHKKPKWIDDQKLLSNHGQFLCLATNKPKMHKCFICGQEFAGGQALGGHMRRHKASKTAFDESLSCNNVDVPVLPQVPVLNRTSSSCRRVLCMDLNLTPLENDLQLLFGNKAPKVDLFI